MRSLFFTSLLLLLTSPAMAQEPISTNTLPSTCAASGLASPSTLTFCAQYLTHNPASPSIPTSSCHACAISCRELGYTLAVSASHCRQACGF